MADPTIRTLTSAGDGFRCQVRHWAAADPLRGSITVLHGIQSHGGWYVSSCAQLADAGFDIWLPDRRGSGLNSDARGDAPGFRQLLDDIAEIMCAAPAPRFLTGISWGGKLALALQRRAPKLTAGLILITPGFCPRVGLSLWDRLRVVGARIAAPSKLFSIPLNEPELFTANSEFQRFIRDDPLALRQATARLLFESARLDIYNRWAARRVTAPVLLLLAERDRIIDNAKTRRYVRKFASRDQVVHEYAGASHTLEFEPGGPPFLADLVAWLRSHA